MFARLRLMTALTTVVLMAFGLSGCSDATDKDEKLAQDGDAITFSPEGSGTEEDVDLVHGSLYFKLDQIGDDECIAIGYQYGTGFDTIGHTMGEAALIRPSDNPRVIKLGTEGAVQQGPYKACMSQEQVDLDKLNDQYKAGRACSESGRLVPYDYNLVARDADTICMTQEEVDADRALTLSIIEQIMVEAEAVETGDIDALLRHDCGVIDKWPRTVRNREAVINVANEVLLGCGSVDWDQHQLQEHY